MFALFRRKTAASSKEPASGVSIGFLYPKSPAVLLATPRRQKLLEHIWQRTSVSRSQFAALYRAPLNRYASLVQQFPASESHHHAYPGGMLDHGLEIVAYALKVRQSHLLPLGAPSENKQRRPKPGQPPRHTQRCCTTSARSRSIYMSNMTTVSAGILGMDR